VGCVLCDVWCAITQPTMHLLNHHVGLCLKHIYQYQFILAHIDSYTSNSLDRIVLFDLFDIYT
jgi:hypothetical protein